MMKSKLPKDWIAVNSKSHPDRVYYFNVKTNQTSWIQPTCNESDKEPSGKKCNNHKEENHITLVSESNNKETEISCQQRLNNKTMENPQIRIIKETLLKAKFRNKSPSSSNSSSIQTNETKKKSYSQNLSRSVTSRDKNDNEVRFSQRMRILHERFKQKISNVSSLTKMSEKKGVNKYKQQVINVAYHEKSTNVSKKQEKNVGNQNVTQNEDNLKVYNKNQTIQEPYENILRKRDRKSFLKTNLAKERMQRLRKNLAIDKEKFEEMYNTNLFNKKPPQKFNKNLSSLPGNSSGSTYKNGDIRLKRLHNKILKNAAYEKSTSKINKPENLEIQNNNLQIDVKMTKEKLVHEAEKKIYEDMDWEPMRVEKITQEVEVVRTQLDNQEYDVGINYMSENIIGLTQPNKVESYDPLYIVVDTNVFLSNLEIIEKAKDIKFKNYPHPFIVIPWTVICELDYFKDNKSKHELSIQARKAISFIHDQFSSRHPRFIGQTREQAIKNKEEFSLSCPDDEILQCCLQIQQLQKSVVLLSYDKNLCTKTMIYNIMALGRHDPLEKIDYFDTNDIVVDHLKESTMENSSFHEELRLTDSILEDVKLIMKNFLSTVIIKQMAEIYGETEWKIYVVIKPPWTAITALKCAIKHWIAAIRESFQRRAECVLKELYNAFSYLPVNKKLHDVEYILEKCSDLVQLVNTNKHFDIMTETCNALTKLKEKCKKYIVDINLKKLHNKIGIAETIEEQEMRAGKTFQCFQHIYNYARDICGLACSNAGIAHSFNFNSGNPSIPQATVQRLRSEITRKVTDLTQELNRLLMQTEDSIKHQTLLNLQQQLNTFLPDTERIIFDIEPADIYYCVKLKEEALKTGLRQLQELTSHFCALAVHTQ